jgi:flagellar basal-body rod protein FlgF
MSDGIYNAASGALARMNQLDVLSNNLANASTSGFRAETISFSDVLGAAGGAELRQAGVVGTRVRDAQGILTQTGRPLDAAIEGSGYFALEGGMLTRNGHFEVDANGTLVGEGGRPVLMADGRPLMVEPDALIAFSENGDVMQNDQVIGTLALKHYDARSLEPVGGTLLKAASSAKELVVPRSTRVVGRTLEGSNTNVLSQMTELITTNRLFDATMNAIDTYKQLDSKTTNGLSRR